MNKSELIEILVRRYAHFGDMKKAVNEMLEQMSESLAQGQRIEIRGFGSFTLHYHAPRVARNPRTGEVVHTDDKYVPHFRPGKELRERVNAATQKNQKTKKTVNR